jgi:HD-GYP domain-containing protein (c-di-GMP phosphodiesterase class II)
VADLIASRLPAPAPAALGAAAGAVACPIGEDEGNVAVLVVEPAGELSVSELMLLQSVTDQALLALSNQQMLEGQERVFLETVQALGAALDAKDEYTQEHAEAMVSLAGDVAERLGMTRDQRRDVAFAAALHDIGKIGIPGAILQKPGPLTDAEYEIVKRHTVIGARILDPVAGLHGARNLVLASHEHWDGSGYPYGLRGEKTPLGARIILACDAYGAITEDRSYRAGRSHADAVDELRRCAGSQFDQRVVETLVGLLEERLRGSSNGAGAARPRPG